MVVSFFTELRRKCRESLVPFCSSNKRINISPLGQATDKIFIGFGVISADFIAFQILVKVSHCCQLGVFFKELDKLRLGKVVEILMSDQFFGNCFFEKFSEKGHC